MEHQDENQPPSLLAQVMAARYGKPEPSCTLLPALEQSTTSLLDDAAASAMATLFPATQPRDALRLQIKANGDLLASGDTLAMVASLSRQATALELAMHGLLAALAAAKAPEQRLALAKAVATLHGAALRSLSAVQQITHGHNREPVA